MNKNKLNFWLDIILGLLFFGLIGSLFQGHGQQTVEINSLHIVTGLLLLAGSFIHLGRHWQWMRAVGQQKNPAPVVHQNWHVATALLFAYGLCGLAGIWLWAFPDTSHALAMVHRIAGFAAIIIQVVHLVRHWKWFTSSARRYLPLGLVRQEQPR